MLPFFSIIIPTYDRPQQLNICLHSLAILEYPRDHFEVIIVNDGSETPPEKVISTFYKNLNVTLLTQIHAGPAAARNTGAAKAKGKFLAFTDDDCMPSPDWLQVLAANFTHKPYCIIGGRTINLLTDNIYSTMSQLILEVVYRHYNGDPHKCRFFATNNLALPANLFRVIGGFDTTFTTSEDREFCDRWLYHGYQMTYAPEVIVYHAHSLTFSNFLRQHFDYGRGAYRFHQVRARRGSGRFRTELKFHLNFRNWLLYPLSKVKGHRVVFLAMLISVWQIANAFGYLWEMVTSIINCYGYGRIRLYFKCKINQILKIRVSPP